MCLLFSIVLLRIRPSRSTLPCQIWLSYLLKNPKYSSNTLNSISPEQTGTTCSKSKKSFALVNTSTGITSYSGPKTISRYGTYWADWRISSGSIRSFILNSREKALFSVMTSTSAYVHSLCNSLREAYSTVSYRRIMLFIEQNAFVRS